MGFLSRLAMVKAPGVLRTGMAAKLESL